MKNYYIKSLKERYGVSNIIKITVLLFMLIQIVDYFNLPTKFISFTNICIVIALVILLLTILLVDFKLLGSLKLAVINISDVQ